MRESFKTHLGTMGTPGGNGCPQDKPLKNKDILPLGDRVDTFQRMRKRAGNGFLKIGDNATNDYKDLYHYALNNNMVNRHRVTKTRFTEEESPVNLFKKLLNKESQNLSAKASRGEAEFNKKSSSQRDAEHINEEMCPLCPQVPSTPYAATALAGDSEISRCPHCPQMSHRDYIDDAWDIMMRDAIVRRTEPVPW